MADYGLVQFLPLDITNEDSVGDLLLFIDNAIQFGEDEDVKVPKVIGYLVRMVVIVDNWDKIYYCIARNLVENEV